MKAIIGIRITGVEIDSNGPAILRRLLLQYCDMIENGQAGLTIPEKVTIGGITIEMGAGPVEAFKE